MQTEQHEATTSGRALAPKCRIGFGTGALGGRTGKKESLRLLATAFEAGIRHFDTAPMYGYGSAEEILGEFLRDKRSDVTLCSKFGIEPPKQSAAMDVARSAARVLISVAPGLRAKISRQANAHVSSGNFNVPHLQMSLDRSLTALQTSYLDIVLMHEPSVEEITAPLTDELECLTQGGRIASYGLAAHHGESFKQSTGDLPGQVLQLSDRAFRAAQASLPRDHLYITHSVFSGALKELTARIETDPSLARTCAERLGFDCKDTRRLGRLSLFAAMQRNPTGVVLFSSLNPDTIRKNAALLHAPEFDAEQARIFDQISEQMSAQGEQRR